MKIFSVIFPGLCSLPSNEQSVFNSTKQAKRTRSTNKILFLLIGLALVVSSCKKIEQFPSTKSVKGLSPAIKSPIETIPYKDFLQAVDINKTGELRKALSITPNNNVKSVNTENETFAFDLDVSNVKKLVIGDTISYVLSLKPRTPGAVHFENITIQTSNGKVAAFLTTYLPTKKWIDDWRTVKHLAFDGEVFVNRIELSDNPVKVEDVKIQSITSTAKKENVITIRNVKIRLAPGECETYDVYEWIPVQCSTGDWPGFCEWETKPFLMGENDSPPGYRVSRTTVVNCAMPGNPGPIGSGGGGGGTTPNPPTGYDPCDPGAPPQISGTNPGLQVMGLPSNCNPTTPKPPAYPFKVQSLIDFYNLQGSALSWVVSNQQTAIAIYEELQADEFSLEGKAAALMTINAAAAGVLSTSNYNYAYTVVSPALPNSQFLAAQVFATYMSIQCAIIKTEHPEYPNWKVYWEASKEMVHLLLDGVGLVPVVGEIADLTNGVLYTIEGDGVNATLSYASAIPVAGWFAAGAKFAKKTIVLANGSKTTLKWAVKVGHYISFGNRSQLRKVLNLAAGDPRVAHHIIPWAKQTEQVIQKAAKSKKAFHMNSALNGIPLNTLVHNGSHAAYDKRVMDALIDIDENLSTEATADALEAVIVRIKSAIIANPTTHINNLIF